MKRILITLAVTLTLAMATFAQANVDNVEFQIRHGLGGNKTLSVAIEKQVSKLLTLLNKAESKNSEQLNFKGINISSEAQAAIVQLWKHNHMRTYQSASASEVVIREDVLRTMDSEYEVRNIPMIFIPVQDPSSSSDEEVALQFDAGGKIVGFDRTMSTQQYSKLLSEMKDVLDEAQRNTIIKWMDNMCTAYNSRDLSWFQKFFSDDVLVITGSRRYTTLRGDNGVRFKQQYFEYVTQNKTQYLNRLSKIFTNNAVLKVKFDDDFVITAHPLRERYYAVELTQRWTSSSYSDVGRLFVVWDFGLEHPQILVRAWSELDDQKRFTFNDIDGLE